MRPAAAPALYGLLAEFDTPQALVDATRRTHQAGYRRFEPYSPFPIEEVSEAMDFRDHRVALLVLAGGIVGAVTGYGMQYFAQAIDFPMNIGGKPYNSWPQFIPITFEMTILFAAIAAVFGMLALNGFPQPYHPVFNVEAFARGSRDRFFLCIEARDPKFELEATRAFLGSLAARGVYDVAP